MHSPQSCVPRPQGISILTGGAGRGSPWPSTPLLGVALSVACRAAASPVAVSTRRIEPWFLEASYLPGLATGEGPGVEGIGSSASPLSGARHRGAGAAWGRGRAQGPRGTALPPGVPAGLPQSGDGAEEGQLRCPDREQRAGKTGWYVRGNVSWPQKRMPRWMGLEGTVLSGRSQGG